MKNKIAILILLLNFAFNWNPISAMLKQVVPLENVWSVYISKNGKKAALRFKGEEDLTQIVQMQNVGVGQIRDAQTWELIKEFKNVRFVYMSPDSSIASIIFADGTAQLINLDQDLLIKELHNVWNIVFSQTGKFVTIVYETETELVDTNSWQVVKKFNNTEKLWLPFSCDDKYVGVAYSGGKVELLNIESGQIAKEFSNIKIFGFVFSCDNKYLGVNYKDNTSELINIDNWKSVKKFEEFELFTISQNSKYLFGKKPSTSVNPRGPDPDPYVLEIVESGSWKKIIEISNVIFCRLSQDNKYFWLILQDKSAKVIDLEKKEVIIQGLENVEECYFYPSHKQSTKLAVALPHEIRIYELP